MSLLPEVISRLTAITVNFIFMKIPMVLFEKNKKTFPKIHMGPQVARTILRKIKKARGSHFLIYKCITKLQYPNSIILA